MPQRDVLHSPAHSRRTPPHTSLTLPPQSPHIPRTHPPKHSPDTPLRPRAGGAAAALTRSSAAPAAGGKGSGKKKGAVRDLQDAFDGSDGGEAAASPYVDPQSEQLVKARIERARRSAHEAQLKCGDPDLNPYPNPPTRHSSSAATLTLTLTLTRPQGTAQVSALTLTLTLI